jgi:type III pantothenate kinase
MTPAVVVDVGNSRIKWGRCSTAGVTEAVSLPPDEPGAWLRQIEAWRLPRPAGWAVSGVHPERRDALIEWLRARGDSAVLVDDPNDLPLRVLLERPDHVGVDRLLDAVAANSRRRPGAPAVIVDAGSAVTVDYVDEDGAFRGGVIFPGTRLMARSLHDYTALLPVVELKHPIPALPATATRPAMEAGIFWAVVGGVEAVIAQYARGTGQRPDLFLTGGDGALLHPALPQAQHWPTMTLEGTRLTAEALP